MLSVCITTQNEGGRLRSTVEAFLSAFDDVEIVVGADAVTDGCCDALPDGCRVVHNKHRIGCGRTKCRIAEKSRGDVLMFIDAHQNVMQGDLSELVELTLSDNVVAQPLLGSLTYNEDWEPKKFSDSTFMSTGCSLAPHVHVYDGLRPGGNRFRTWGVGVGLTMSRTTYELLGGWNRFRAFFGSQERGMGLRALAADIPIICCPNVVLGHEFGSASNPSRPSFPYKPAYNSTDANHNLYHSYYVVSDDEEWELIKTFLGARASNIENDESAVLDRQKFGPLRKLRPGELVRELGYFWEPLSFCEPPRPIGGFRRP